MRDAADALGARTVDAMHVDGLPLGQHEQLQQLGSALVREGDLVAKWCHALRVVAHAVLLAPAEQVGCRRLWQQRDH